MGVVEIVDDDLLVFPRQGGWGKIGAQLETLALVTAFRDDLEFLLGAGNAVRVQFCVHRIAQPFHMAVDARDVLVRRGIEDEDSRLGMFILQVGLEQAHRRGDARRHRHDHIARADRLCQGHAVQGPGAAEGHDREFARVDAAGDRVGPDRQGHVVVDDPDDPQRRIGDGQAQRLGDLFPDGPARQFGVQPQIPAQCHVGIETAQDDLGVGDGRLLSAAAIAGGPGLRSGRSRPDIERARLVDEGDRAAARPDGDQVDHRREDGIAGDIGIALVHDLQRAARNGRDVGRGAADVDGDDVGRSRHRALGGAADDAARGAGHQDADRPARAAFHGRDAAVRLHDPQLGGNARLAQAGIQIAQVIGCPRPDIAIHRGRREPFIFPHHTGQF